jgi:hypothetical protein
MEFRYSRQGTPFGCEFLKAVTMKSTISWDVTPRTPCSLTLQKNVLSSPSGLKSKLSKQIFDYENRGSTFPETLVNFYWAAGRQIPEDGNVSYRMFV